MLSATLIRALRRTHVSAQILFDPCKDSSEMIRTVWSLGSWLFSITHSSDGVGSTAFPLAISHLCFCNTGSTINLGEVNSSKRGKSKHIGIGQMISLCPCLPNYTFLFSILFPKESFELDHFLGLHFLHSLSRGLLTASDRAPHTCSLLK